MSALINTKKPYRHFFLFLFGFVTKNSSAEKSAEKLTEKSAEKSTKKSAKKSTKKLAKKQKKLIHRLKECGTDNDPCERVNELSAPCNQTLPPPTSKVSIYEVTSYGNGALCNCNKLYYETLQSCTYCMDYNSSFQVSIQPLKDWKDSCMKFGTNFTEFPPFDVTPYSQLDGGNSTTNTTQIEPLSDSNNVAFDILLSICVIETVLIIAGLFSKKGERPQITISWEIPPIPIGILIFTNLNFHVYGNRCSHIFENFCKSGPNVYQCELYLEL
ncbi:hypothetical protein F8M41_025112 [Gigaspora margarita]|uniref:Uncharacterized protein n=1 Tax=Gigaspora margarita TaxID=4874 RepID=A0A8H4AAD9_GIGMA|nr:hypothetical protein F8M41_025112 [Gigaspora margarita]